VAGAGAFTGSGAVLFTRGHTDGRRHVTASPTFSSEGFYEWARRGDGKRPFYFHLRSGEPFAVAGLWEVWEGGGRVLQTCTLLTTEANDLLAPYHDRMPVILKPEDYDLWLDADVRSAERLLPLLRPYSREEMTTYAVRPVVNSPSNDGPSCVEPAREN
jgi:putative SOS response-associated peptidase YedK